MRRAEVYHTHSDLLGGTPVFTGTRVPVDVLIQHLRSGTALDAFLDDFPSVSREQAEAFLDLALKDALERIPRDAQPVVTGPSTTFAGAYKLGTPPRSLVAHNLESWRIIEAILTAYGQADFWDLAVAVRGHKHGQKAAKGPQSFVRYCIRSGWLARV